MMVERQPARTAVNTLSEPRRVVITAWAILLALLLVYARDVHRWAEAAESAAVHRAVLPVAGVLHGASQSMGVAPAREYVERAVHSVYGGTVILADRQSAAVHAALPSTEVHAALASGKDESAGEGQPAVQEAESQWRILLVGDSSIQEGLGTEIERGLEAYEGVTVERLGKYSTGLARPDYFDWPAKLAELKEEFKPNIIVAHWGDNDCQGLSSLKGEFVAHFGTDEWDEEYGQRVKDVVSLMREGGCGAVIVGLPIMRSKSFSKRVSRLNGVVKQSTTATGGVYLSTWDITSDEDGNYLSSVEFEGKKRIIRASDGIHLSNHGAAYVADWICKRLEKQFGLVPIKVDEPEGSE